MPPDSSAIDTALITRLQSDATLMGYMPDGVWFDYAPQGSQRFVLVSLVENVDVPIFAARAIESVRYLVKAVELASGSGKTGPAAARIDALLENTTLVVSGYGASACYRVQRVRYVEVDDDDPAIRWQHRGGHYEVQMTIGN